MKRPVIAVVGAALLLCLSLAACEADTADNSAQNTGQQLTEDAFAKQQTAVPYPAAELTDSLERRNLAERLRRTNLPNKIGYVYLLSFAGTPLGYYTIKGKVSNTDSQMTTSELVVTKCHSNGCNEVTVPAPGDDGSYGANEPGVFFFTTENAFVTTNLNYLYSDQPLPLNVPLLNKK